MCRKCVEKKFTVSYDSESKGNIDVFKKWMNFLTTWVSIARQKSAKKYEGQVTEDFLCHTKPLNFVRGWSEAINGL